MEFAKGLVANDSKIKAIMSVTGAPMGSKIPDPTQDPEGYASGNAQILDRAKLAIGRGIKLEKSEAELCDMYCHTSLTATMLC
eukprot:6149410-Amphidinium_carterae.1